MQAKVVGFTFRCWQLTTAVRALRVRDDSGRHDQFRAEIHRTLRYDAPDAASTRQSVYHKQTAVGDFLTKIMRHAYNKHIWRRNDVERPVVLEHRTIYGCTIDESDCRVIARTGK